MFPNDSITIYNHYIGNQDFTEVLPVGDYTILGINLYTETDFHFYMTYYCGDTPFFTTREKNVPIVLLNYKCINNSIKVDINGGFEDEYYNNLTYTPYNLTTIPVASTTLGFTNGEIVSTFFVFMIFVIILTDRLLKYFKIL